MAQENKLAFVAIIISLFSLGFTFYEIYSKYLKEQEIIVTVINPSFSLFKDDFNAKLIFINNGNNYSTIFNNEMVFYQDENNLFSCLDSVEAFMISSGLVNNISFVKSTQPFILKPDEQICINFNPPYFFADSEFYKMNGIEISKPISIGFLISCMDKEGKKKSKLIPFGWFRSSYGIWKHEFSSVSVKLNGKKYIESCPLKLFLKISHPSAEATVLPRKLKVTHPYAESVLETK